MSNIILPDEKSLIVPSVGIAGEFMFEKYRLKSYGKKELIYRDDFWRKNLITDIGLDRIGSGELGKYLRIGTGTTAPSVSDTGMSGYSATSSSAVKVSSVNNGAPNYEQVFTSRFDFAAGVLNGTYTEIGVSWSNTNTANTQATRSLILDASGNPASITVNGPYELLQVTYRLTWYPNIADVSGSISITGSGTHSYTARPFRVNNGVGSYFDVNTFSDPSYNNHTVYTGSLVSITATSISGTSAVVRAKYGTYAAGSYSKNVDLAAAVTEGNLSGGIKTLLLSLRDYSYTYTTLQTQIEFTPAIPKTSAQTLSLPFSFGWGRHA